MPQDGAPSGQAASRKGLVAAIAILAIVLIVAGVAYQMLVSQSSPESASHTSSNHAADALFLADFDFEVQTADGAPLSLTQIADGKPLVVNVWATWCPYCIQEMDDFQAIYDDYSDRVSFAFVDATDGSRETVEDGKAWIADTGYTLPFYFDVARQVVSGFGVSGYPTTIVASADGELLAISSGRINPELMRSALDSLL